RGQYQEDRDQNASDHGAGGVRAGVAARITRII
ncbi:MAG: hypothetical protein AVDCRST_MAG68-4165, partial [uncultured Gemmatimonadetes bacterium]